MYIAPRKKEEKIRPPKIIFSQKTGGALNFPKKNHPPVRSKILPVSSSTTRLSPRKNLPKKEGDAFLKNRPAFHSPKKIQKSTEYALKKPTRLAKKEPAVEKKQPLPIKKSPINLPAQKIDDFPEEERPKEKFSPAEAILHWQAPEFETLEKNNRGHLWTSLTLLAIIAWAVYSDSPIMAITFILIGVLGYIYSNRQPEVLDFWITREGILAEKEMHDFDSIKSFWIFYEEKGRKIISLKTKNHFSPLVHIPLGDQNPSDVREILLKFSSEEKQDPGIWNILESLVRL